jgi:hypothetical protein
VVVLFDLSPRTERCTWHRRGDDGPQCMASRSPYVHPYHSTMEPAGPETELPPQDPTATTTNRVPREQMMSCRKFHSTSQQLNDDPTGPWPAGWNDKDVAPNRPRASKGWGGGIADSRCACDSASHRLRTRLVRALARRPDTRSQSQAQRCLGQASLMENKPNSHSTHGIKFSTVKSVRNKH